MNKWGTNEVGVENFNLINGFDFNANCDELCYVTENGNINFIRLHSPGSNVHTLGEYFFPINFFLIIDFVSY